MKKIYAYKLWKAFKRRERGEREIMKKSNENRFY